LVSCSQQTPRLESRAALSIYRCTYYYEFIKIASGNGHGCFIDFDKKSDAKALSLLAALKPSLHIGLTGDGTSSRLHFIGYLTGQKALPSKGNFERDSLFVLKGWFIETPYVEYPQAPGYEPQPKAVKRRTLSKEDFTRPVDEKMIHYNSVRGVYWVGVEPR